MESYQITIGNNNKVEFQGVRNTYPTGETTTVYFTLPVSYKPEQNDWIGIYPVGWSQLSHFTCKRMVKPENVWSVSGQQLGGKVEFDGEVLPKQTEQYYQFVYVKGGEYIRGASTPFMFAPVDMLSLNGFEQQQEEQIFGQKKQQQWYQPQQWEQREQRGLEQVEREMQKLQNGLFGLEQGLYGYKTVFPLIEETLIQQQQPQQWTREGPCKQQQPCGEWKWTSIFGGENKQQQQQQKQQLQQQLEQLLEQQQPQRKHWQQRVEEVRQMLVEQARVEQAQRRIEQLSLLTQLKNYERHIQTVQKHEQEIKQYLRNKQQTKVAEFEQKVYQVLKQQQQLNGESQFIGQQQPEHYVRKYEQLLKEKIELDLQKRQAIMHKLRQTIKECERKLQQVQQGEQQHFARFQQALKVKIGHGIPQYQQEECQEQEIKEQLRRQVSQFVAEQRKEQFNLIKAQKQMVCLINEISSRLQELEYEELYTQLRVPRIQYTVGQQYYGQQPQPQQQQYYQIQQLEQQLNELKNVLRVKQLFYGKQQQLTTGSWMKPIAQKLRVIREILRIQREQQQQQPQQQQQWFEQRIQNVSKHVSFFECEQQQQLTEECRVREILGQLRELESELEWLCEYPQQQQQYGYPKSQQLRQQIAELCQVVREKIGQLAQVYEQSPIECFIQSGNHSAWKQMMHLERKLVQLKGMMVEKQQYQHLQQRLAELEQLNNGNKQQQQIKAVRQMLEQHQQQCQQQWQQLQQQQPQPQQWYQQQPQQLQQQQPQPQQWFQQQPQHYLFVAQPEQYQQHQQKYERLCQLVLDLESQQTEQSVYQRLPTKVTGQQQQQQGAFGLNLIQQQFQQLVQQFQQRLGGCQPQQQQMPEQLAQQIEQIGQFVRQQLVNETLKSKPFYGQQLREKIDEFENILTLLNLEQQQQQLPSNWTQYIRQVGRQVRDLKHEIQSVLDGWVLVNCQQQQQPELESIEGDLNNNNVFGGSIVFEPIESLLPEISLGELLTGRREQQLEQEIFGLPRSGSFRQQLERQLGEQECEIYMPTVYGQEQQQQKGQRQLNVETLIGELETELVKLRLQKEFPFSGYSQQSQQQCQVQQQQVQQQQQGQQTTARVVLTTGPIGGEQFDEQLVQNKIQNLLTTVVPTIVKVAQQQQEKIRGEQQQQQQSTTTTVYNVEPTPFGSTGQCIKVQQKETVQQQF